MEDKPVDVDKLKAIRNKIRKENQEKYLENSKDRLGKIITTKIIKIGIPPGIRGPPNRSINVKYRAD